MATMTVIWWRDIPAQVTARDGRRASKIVLHPRFDPEHIEKERQVIFEEIKMVEDSPNELVYDLFHGEFWKSHPLGRPIHGTVDSVKALDQPTLTRFFADSYHPENVVIAAAGNLSHDRFSDLAHKAFDSMPRSRSRRPITPPDPHAGIITREKKDL